MQQVMKLGQALTGSGHYSHAARQGKNARVVTPFQTLGPIPFSPYIAPPVIS